MADASSSGTGKRRGLRRRRSGGEGRLAVLAQNYRMTREVYPRIGWEMLGLFLAVAVVIAVPLWIFLNPPTAILVAVPFGLLAATYWFSRKAMRAAYKRIEGEPGAAAAVVQSMRGNWSVTPAVAVTKNQDVVSRVVGRCGVVLIGEGPSTRITHLLANERKKTARWLPETPIFDIQVGTEGGQVPLAKLQKELTRLPAALRPPEVTDVRRRLEALDRTQTAVPLPKGPLPRNARMPRPPRA